MVGPDLLAIECMFLARQSLGKLFFILQMRPCQFLLVVVQMRYSRLMHHQIHERHVLLAILCKLGPVLAHLGIVVEFPLLHHPRDHDPLDHLARGVHLLQRPVVVLQSLLQVLGAGVDVDHGAAVDKDGQGAAEVLVLCVERDEVRDDLGVVVGSLHEALDVNRGAGAAVEEGDAERGLEGAAVGVGVEGKEDGGEQAQEPAKEGETWEEGSSSTRGAFVCHCFCCNEGRVGEKKEGKKERKKGKICTRSRTSLSTVVPNCALNGALPSAVHPSQPYSVATNQRREKSFVLSHTLNLRTHHGNVA